MLSATNSALLIAGAISWIAAVVDVRTGKIPNWLVVTGTLLGIVAFTLTASLEGMATSVGGLTVGLAVMLPGYLIHSTSAGDVKLVGALGAITGPATVLFIFAASMLAGAVIGIAIALHAWATKGATPPFQRYGKMLRLLWHTGQIQYSPPAPNEAMGTRFAFALPIAVGTTVIALHLLEVPG